MASSFIDQLIAFCIAFVICGILGLTANIAQSVLLYRKRKNKSLFDLSLSSLCVADIIVSLAFIAFGLAQILILSKPLTLDSLKIYRLVSALFLNVINYSIFCSLFHVVFIALQRFMVVFFPLKFKVMATKMRCIIFLAVVWVASVGFMALGHLKQRRAISRFYGYFIFILGALLVILYIAICYRVFRSAKLRLAPKRDETSSKRLAVHAVAVTTIFIVCNFPYASLQLTGIVPVTYSLSLRVLLGLNPLLDSVVYFFAVYCRKGRSMNAAPSSNTGQTNHHSPLASRCSPQPCIENKQSDSSRLMSGDQNQASSTVQSTF